LVTTHISLIVILIVLGSGTRSRSATLGHSGHGRHWWRRLLALSKVLLVERTDTVGTVFRILRLIDIIRRKRSESNWKALVVLLRNSKTTLLRRSFDKWSSLHGTTTGVILMVLIVTWNVSGSIVGTFALSVEGKRGGFRSIGRSHGWRLGLRKREVQTQTSCLVLTSRRQREVGGRLLREVGQLEIRSLGSRDRRLLNRGHSMLLIEVGNDSNLRDDRSRVEVILLGIKGRLGLVSWRRHLGSAERIDSGFSCWDWCLRQGVHARRRHLETSRFTRVTGTVKFSIARIRILGIEGPQWAGLALRNGCNILVRVLIIISQRLSQRVERLARFLEARRQQVRRWEVHIHRQLTGFMSEGLLTPSHKDTSTGRLLGAAVVSQSKVQALVRVVGILQHLLLHVSTVKVV
jgi:hypothetical protein